MTEKLYYQDSKLCSFEASVESCVPHKNGFNLILNRTTFFPEGGGQPCDFGVIDDANVSDVSEEKGIVVHFVDKCFEAGQQVKGKIDWTRRLHNMQSHTGEHIVSGIVESLTHLNNVGTHIGNDCTISFDGVISDEQVKEIEQQANIAISKNIPIQVDILKPGDTVSDRVYRFKKQIEGDMRIVSIEGIDSSACCGTHCYSTGEVGIIKIIQCHAYKGGSRIHLMCGMQALQQFQFYQSIINECKSLLAASEENICTYIKGCQNDVKTLKNEKQKLLDQTFVFRANEMKDSVCRPVLFENNLTMDEIRRFAQILSNQCSIVCIFTNGSITPCTPLSPSSPSPPTVSEVSDYKYVVCSKSQDIRSLTKLLNQSFGGKGGGTANMSSGTLKGNEQLLKEFIDNWKV